MTTHMAQRVLADEGLWRIDQVDVRRPAPGLGELNQQNENILVLLVAGLFFKHDGPRHRVMGTPNDAVLIGAGRPYRLSFPGGIGDSCLTVRFSNDALSQFLPVPELLPRLFTAPVLLPAHLLLARNILWRRFQSGEWDAMEVDELSGRLVEATLELVLADVQNRRPNPPGRLGSIEAVKEAVALDPAHKWSLDALAKLANTSPFHLSRLFRQIAGTSIYDYVVRTRLAAALEFLLDTKMDLTAIGLEVGFSSHSHFTARFHSFFGMTPTAFRRAASSAIAAEMSRIVTAGKVQSC